LYTAFYFQITEQDFSVVSGFGYLMDFLTPNLRFILRRGGSLSLNGVTDIAAQKILVLFMKYHCIFRQFAFGAQLVGGG
jgi:hypothetical protein